MSESVNPIRMAERVAAFDWSQTPLGPRERWPQALRIAVDIVLNSRFPMFVWWGPQRINIYNDAYAPILGKRHPDALGRPARSIWSEIWDVVGPQSDAVFERGEATWNDRVQLIMERQGYTEETWFTWSYSPIYDVAGGIGGMFCACTEETARVRAERDLKENQRRFQALATAGAQVLYRMNADWSEMRALDGQGVLADSQQSNVNWLSDYIHPDDQPRVTAAISEAVRTRSLFELEHRVRRVDGSLGWTLSRAVPLLNEEGEIDEWIGAASDITERRELSDRFNRQSRLFEQIASTTPDFIYVFDRNWRFLYANKRLLDVWGKTYDQAVGRGLAELGYPDWHVEMHHRELEQVVRTRQSVRGLVPFTGGSGMSGVYEYIFTPVLGPDGEVEVIAGTTRDVTDREKLLAELKTERSNLAGVIQNAPAFIATVRGPDHVFELTNQRYVDLIGGREVLGKPVSEALPEIAEQGFVSLLDEVYRTGEPHVATETTVMLRTKTDPNLSRHVLTFVYQALRDSAGQIAGVFVHGVDVTDLVAAREARRDSDQRALDAERAARSDAERASRMKDEFLATLSHELRTPLNAIFGWSRILAGGGRSQKEIAHGLEIIERNARAQTQIIEDLLEMSRIISGKVRLDVQQVDLAAAIRAAIDTVRPAADARGVKLRMVLDDAVGPIAGDPNRLQQVFWNLLSNAVKFTASGGHVDVVLARVASHLQISVTDTGEGIRPEFLPHVFDRFRQADASTSRRHGGLGLGLAIVKQLVELHGGSVRASSEGAGMGSTFTLMLPLGAVLPEPEPDLRSQHRTHGLHGTIPRIAGVSLVVIDDESDARSMVRRLLEEAGATVRTGSSADEALQLIADQPPDLLISDIGMPGEDGFSLIRRLRSMPDEQGGRVPAIALTAYARTEDRVRTLQAGYQAHIIKPVDPAELITAIAALAGTPREA